MRITKVQKQSRKCDLCGTYKNRSVFYSLKRHPAVVKLLEDKTSKIVCSNCAMKEEFGNNYKQSKRYKQYLNRKDNDAL